MNHCRWFIRRRRIHRILIIHIIRHACSSRLNLVQPFVEFFVCVFTRFSLILLATPLVALFGVELLDRCGARSNHLSQHCTLDLGNFLILNRIDPRVLSCCCCLFCGVVLKFLRGIFFPAEFLVQIQLLIVCHFLRQLVRGFDKTCTSTSCSCIKLLQLMRLNKFSRSSARRHCHSTVTCMFRMITSLVLSFQTHETSAVQPAARFLGANQSVTTFTNTGIHHEFFGLDNSQPWFHTCLLRHRQLSSLPSCRSTLPLSFHLSAVLSLSRRFLVSARA